MQNMMNEPVIETYKLNTISAKLSEFDILAKDHDFIEVSEWHNGEGWNITIEDRIFFLTYGELKAINTLTNLLELKKVTVKNNE